jgi:uncharacterized protein YegL
MAFDPSQFTVQKAKPLPVMLLLDVSGSMSGVKIDTLNQAVRSMLETFIDETTIETDIVVSIITFGDELKRLFPFTPAPQVRFENLSAYGGTPLGEALKMAKAIIEDRDETPSRSYRPTIVLVSDGRPGDEWRRPLEAFVSEGRSAKCDRMAMAIGADADRSVLESFIQGTSNPLFEARRASEILGFFKKVTMSVTMRTKAQNPNVIPVVADVPVASTSATATQTAPESHTVNVSLDGRTMQSVSEVPSVDDDEYF